MTAIVSFIGGAAFGVLFAFTWAAARFLKRSGPHCPTESAIRVYRDGDQWCAVLRDFDCLQKSFAGFGDTKEEAIKALWLAANTGPERRRDSLMTGPNNSEKESL